MFKTNLARENWQNKYQYKGESPLETQIRMATAIASVEKEPEKWKNKFLNVLVKFNEDGEPIGLKNTLGGRVTANLGTEYHGATLLNCFVNGVASNATIKYDRIIPGTDKKISVEYKTEETGDNLRNIMLTLLEQAETLKSEGGYGINFGFIRPRGSLIKSIGIRHPGVVHYMGIWDVVANVIVMGDNDGYEDTIENYLDIDEDIKIAIKKQARKGAQMAVLPIWHPDIEEFVRAKQEGGRLTKFNLSVLVDNEFLTAVEKDDFYNLHFEGKIYKRVKAAELYDLIMKSTYNRAEPGVLFYDNMQSNNPLSYLGPVVCTNPCVTKDTWIMTSNGARKVEDLIGCEFEALVDGSEYLSEKGFFCTGKKAIFEVVLDNGMRFRATGNHMVEVVEKLDNRKNRFKYRFVEINGLKVGDKVSLMNHRDSGLWDGLEDDDHVGINDKEWNTGWLLGELIGNGDIAKEGVASLYFYGDSASHMSDLSINQISNVFKPRKKIFWCQMENKIRIKSSGLFRLAEKCGIYNFNKNITDKIEKKSFDFCAGFLRGVFDASGVVDGDFKNGASIRLASNSLANLYAVQRMLARFGIISTVYEEGRLSEVRVLSNKNGEKTECLHNVGGELSISKDNIGVFASLIGFYEPEKKMSLLKILGSYKKSPYKEEFASSINKIVKCGKESVYDCVVEGVHVFDGNGCVLHNCGEIPGNAKTSTVCLLGSANLTQYVKEDRTFDWDLYENDVAVFARMLDNVNDLTNAPLPQYEWAVRNIRQYGMGINGLGSAMYMMGIKYNSIEADEFVDKVTSIKEEITWKTSALLAKEKGCFPAYNEKFLETNWFKNYTKISESTKDLIREYGARNGKTTTNPPLGNCQPLDTEIITSNGVMSLERIFESNNISLNKHGWNIKDDCNLKVFTMDGFKEITGFYINGDSVVREIKTKNGKKVIGTFGHKILVKTSKDKNVWKRISGITSGDVIIYLKNTADISNLDCSESEVVSIKESKVFTVDIEVKDAHHYIMENGIISHNSSVICDMVSNAIEPVFDKEYDRIYIANKWPEGLTKQNVKRVLTKKSQGDVFVWQGNLGGVEYLYEPHNRGLCIVEKVRDYGYQWILDNHPEDIDSAEDYLVTARDIEIKDHIRVQAIAQRNCNQSISKTCNLPSDYSFDKFKDLYLQAWKAGLNGFTTYREGSMEAVLSTVEKNNGTREIIKKNIKLPDSFINGPMSVIKREGMKFYFHFSYLPEDVERIFPVSLWLNTNSYGEIREANAVVRALIELLEKLDIDRSLIECQKEKIRGNPGNQRVAKMISMCLRHNIPIVNIVHVLDRIPDIYVTDTIFAVKKFLSQHIEDGSKVLGAVCKKCKSTNIIYTGGCSVCKDCGNSLCG